MMKHAAKANYFRVAGVTLSEFCNNFRFLAVQRVGSINLPQLAGVIFGSTYDLQISRLRL